MKEGWVYILTNKPNGILYIGVTHNITQRVWQHQEELTDGFTKRYNLKRLVFMEQHATIADAIRREKTMKTWRRAWKVRLIETHNPEWNDLSNTLL